MTGPYRVFSIEGLKFVEGDWNAKVGKAAYGNWQGICGPFCNNNTKLRGLKTSGVFHL